uniref:RING-type E3 ubiquitin transferase n=1 Tax=Noccaea caerulescens TaxID=107243 RepID=A0A1J3JZ13_NOCCA
MGSIGEIGGDEMVLDVDETIFVAVSEEVERSRTTVLWAARNFSGKKICLLYVHRPVRPASWTQKKLVGGTFRKHAVKVIERVDKQKVDEIMDSYLRLLSQAEVQTDKLCIAGQNVEEGIVELIARHKIKWFVMGAASDKHYSWKMTDLKSKKAIYVCKKAPDSCHIWFLCKGYLIFTRATNDVSNNRQTMPPLVQLDSDTETRKSEKMESSYMRRRLRYWRSLLEQDGEKDTGQLEREKVEPRATSNVSSGSGSSFGEPVGPEPPAGPDPSGPELACSDTLTTSNTEEKKREGNVAREVHRYDKAMHDIGQSERTVYGEARNESKENDSTMEALCKAKALDGLCIKESSRRKKLEELLEKEKDEVNTVIEQNNGFMKKLQMVEGDNLKLESQIRKLQDLEREHGEKFDTAMELLKSFRQKRDEIRIDHEKAMKEVNALKRLIKGKTVESGSEMLDYSFMEINEATNEFDPSWKLGEGKYGSVYKGNLQHLQVAVKMLPSYGSQNHFEFERRVEILSRVRHPNLVTLVGTCPEYRSIIYQYIPSGSLEDCLSSTNNVPPLSWESRIRIASEICSALLFLHSNVPCIIHGNLKPSKILLDSNLVTKISDYGISQLIPIDGVDKSDPHVDPHYFVSGEMTLESDVYSFGMILLQLLTRRPLSGVLRDVKCAVENDNISAVLDDSAGEWPIARGKKLANIAIRCCKKNPLNRPDLAMVLKFIDRMKVPEVPSSELSSYSDQKAPRRPPSHYLCPIFQEVMKDPLIAADGFTYEAEAIREWLANGHDTSPMTNLKMEDCNLIPNHALHLAIQDWQNQW